MATRMQQRRGTAAQWISTNSGQGPVLNAGEIGFEIDNNRFKIGDGVNHWVDLPYFANNEAITDLIDGAPALLDTLNELAAAVGDDPAFFTTVATNLSNHQSDTTNIHGIADTALLATKAYADNAVSAAVGTLVDSAPDLLNTLNEIAAAIGDDPAFITTVAGQLSNHQTDTTNIHGIPDTANLETKTGAQTKIDTAVDNHSSDTTNIHGIADTSALETQDGAQSKVDAHNSDTTSVHGIADTSVLETQSGAQSKVDTAVSNHNSDTTNVHGIADTSALATQTNVSDAVSTHNSDTTNVHGIADTAQLATTSATASAISTAVSDHNSDTTNVHGISNTADLATTSATASAISTAVSDHNSDTTSVHGIANTEDLATKAYVDEAVGDATVDQSLLAGVGIDWNVGTEQFDIDSTVSTKTYADDAVSAHNSDTTNIHGIADTAALETTSGAQSKIDASISTHNSDTTDVHGIADTAQLATKNYSDNAVSTHNSDTTNVHGIVNTADLATKNYADSAVSTHQSDTTSVHGIADTSALALTSDVNDSISGAISTHNSDSTNVHGIDDTAALATKTYVAGLLVNATKANITITGDVDGLTINAENGVADSDTDFLTEGTNNLYFTTERAQDAVGNSVGTGLTYTDATGEIKVDTTVVQTRVTNISDTEIGYLDGLSSNIQTQIDTKAALVSPTFTGTVSGITKTMVGLGNVDNTSDANKPVSTAQASAIATAKSEAIADATSQVNAVIASAPAALNTLDELAAALGDDANFAGTITSTLATKAPLDAPTFTGTVSGITKSMVGLGNVDNTSDADKPVSSATQTALNLKANSADIAELAQDAVGNNVGSGLAYTDSTGAIGINYVALGDTLLDGVSGASYGLIGTSAYLDVKTGNGYNKEIEVDIAAVESKLVTDGFAKTSDIAEFAQDAVNTAIVAGAGLDKAYDDLSNTITLDIDSTVVTLSGAQTLTNKTITSPSGLVKADVGLANVDNTTDAGKPVSTATQTALDLKAPLANPTFTGTVTLPTGTVTSGMILDGAIVNADINASAAIAQSKISGLTSDLASKLALAGGTMTGALTLSGAPTSDLHAATKLYVDNVTAGINFHEAVHAASTVTLAANYNNGTSGVGATLTADTNRAFSTLDGESVVLGERVLIKNQTDAKQNGIYTLTTVGSVSTPWVLTRATDADNNPTGEMKTGDFTFVQRGTVNASVGYINNSTASPIVIGTDNISYTEFNAGKTVVAGTGLTEATPGTISVATGGVTSAMIADGTIVDGDISASAAIAQSKVSGLTSDLAAKAPIANPTFTGTVAGITKGMVGLGNVDNTTDAGKPISTATQTALDLKAPLANPTFTGTVSGVTKSHVGLGNVDNTADADKPVSSATTTALALKANLASPTLTGTPLSTTAAADTNTTQIATTAYVVGQASSSTPVVNGTAAVGTSLKYARADHVHGTDTSRAPLASPTFTGTVTLPTGTVTSAMILDGTIVDGDISATAAIAQSKISGLSTSLGLKADLASPALTGTPTAPTAAAGTNTTQVATTAFVGTAVADLVASAPSALNTLNELATALGNDASFSTTVTNSLAAKAPLASPTFTGTATIPTLTLTNPLTAANGGTGLSSLGAGVATFLGTPSSANLAAMITDEIGTGNIVLSEIATSSQTASYTLVAGDRGKLVEMNVGSANTLTVPLNSTVPYPVGTQIDILQVGSGQTTVAGAVGVTINGTPGLKIRAQWGGATLIKRATDTWVLIGDLTA